MHQHLIYNGSLKSMRAEIKEMADKNIGSLSNFLKNDKNINYLNHINSNIPIEIVDFSISEKVYYFVYNIQNLILCDCGKHRKFIGFKNGYRTTCGKRECILKKRKETCIENWGVDNPKKSKQILEKEKENIKKKWGRHYMLSNVVKNKFKMTMIDNWGVEWPMQSREIKDKSLETWNKNPNKLEIINTRKNGINSKQECEWNEINQKRKETIQKNWNGYENFINYRLNAIRDKSLEKWGVDHHLKSEDVIKKRVKSYRKNIIDKVVKDLPENLIFNYKKENKNSTDCILNFNCKKCNGEFSINRQLFYMRKNSGIDICLGCNPILSGKSKREVEILDFIKENYQGTIKSNANDIITGELDIYLPDLSLAFEFNGVYWHSELYKDKNYHLNKTQECIEKNIDLIHIWEDDWDYKKNIVKSIILNKLGKSKKIFARVCQIREVSDVKLIRDFLNENHIQGFVGSKIKLGLFHGDKLVSLMTFGMNRSALGLKSRSDSFELLRFCSLLNTIVVGGASKLFRHFVKNYEFCNIISYSDNSRGNGNLYKKIGFQYIGETPPNYYWVINRIKKHRFNFRKDKLVREGADPNKTEIEIMTELGFYRLFDCGSKKWNFFKNK